MKENNYPLFSIIIPTYNRSKLLISALKSCLAQTFSSFEVIIVDDCSTDDTEKIVKDFIKLDNRIRYFKMSSNRGVAAARNFGIQKARGLFITFLDDDDELAPDYLEEINKLNLKPNEIFIVMVAEFRCLRILNLNVRKYFNPRLSLRKWEVAIGNSCTVSKKIFTDLNIWFDEKLSVAEDIDTGIRAMQLGVPIIFIDKPIFYRYLNLHWKNKSLSTSRRIEVYQNYKIFYEKNYKFFEENGKEALAFLNYSMGIAAAKGGLISEAKKYFFKAFHFSKKPRYFICWIMSFFGRRIFSLFYILSYRFMFLIRLIK